MFDGKKEEESEDIIKERGNEGKRKGTEGEIQREEGEGENKYEGQRKKRGRGRS